MPVLFDVDAMKVDTTSRVSFPLAGRTWRCRNCDMVDGRVAERLLFERPVLVASFFRGVLVDEDVAGFVELLEADGVSLPVVQALMADLTDALFPRRKRPAAGAFLRFGGL